ncbi:MAG: PQQ-dependent sugar dehydrogenase, partial [Bacteroidota bacterium]
MNINFIGCLLMIMPVLTSCQDNDNNGNQNIDLIELPSGFHIEVYVEDIPNARAMVLADDGTLFVGSRSAGKIYAVTAGEREVIVLDENISSPAGVDIYQGDLYVSAVSRILKYPDILNHLDDPPEPVVITDQYPDEAAHGWKFIKFGPDDKLYVPVGAPCNICLSQDSIFASITRINPDGSNMEIIAHGVRNTVGFDWHPQTGVLWFTENGRDHMGDHKPPDEINKLTATGQHFGYPYVHGDSITDPQFWQKRPKDFKWKKPEVKLEAHVAALGM